MYFVTWFHATWRFSLPRSTCIDCFVYFVDSRQQPGARRALRASSPQRRAVITGGRIFRWWCHPHIICHISNGASWSNYHEVHTSGVWCISWTIFFIQRQISATKYKKTGILVLRGLIQEFRKVSLPRSTCIDCFVYFVTCIEIGSGSTVTSFPLQTIQWCLIWHQMFRNWQYCNVKTAWNDTVVTD